MQISTCSISPWSIRITCKVLRGRGKLWKFYGEGKVGDLVVAEAEFTAMMVPPEEA